MNKKHITNFVIALTFLIPLVSFGALELTKGLVNDFWDIVKLLRPIVFALALLFFFWGMAQFILHAGDEDGREKGKQVMMWGIVALFVISTIWGITGFIEKELLGPNSNNSGNNSGGFFGNETSYDFPQTP